MSISVSIEPKSEIIRKENDLYLHLLALLDADRLRHRLSAPELGDASGVQEPLLMNFTGFVSKYINYY